VQFLWTAVLFISAGICYDGGDKRTIVCTNAGRLPAGVVTGRVGMIKLELVMRVVAGVQKGHAEWSKTCVGSRR
jgi:hypothetical protein